MWWAIVLLTYSLLEGIHIGATILVPQGKIIIASSLVLFLQILSHFNNQLTSEKWLKNRTAPQSHFVDWNASHRSNSILKLEHFFHLRSQFKLICCFLYFQAFNRSENVALHWPKSILKMFLVLKNVKKFWSDDHVLLGWWTLD